jgi:stress response protein YsnF
MSADPVVTDRDGRSGTVESTGGGRVRVRLPSGAIVDLPGDLARPEPDGTYRADVSFAALDGGERAVFHEVDERVRVETRVRETGRVRARVVTDTVEEPVEADGWRETVAVERVPVGREVEAAEPPREEGGVTVIPVYEEVLVVQKRLVLREEVRLTTRREPVPGPERVTLRRQRVEVERLPPPGGPPDAGAPDG